MINRKIFQFKKLVETNDKEIENFIQNLADKELMQIIYFYLKEDIFNTVKYTIFSYKKIPISAEDIFNEFLSEGATAIKKYKYIKESNFKYYVLKVVKNFCLNKTSFWMRRKRLMNSDMTSVDDLYYVKDESTENNINDAIDEIDFKNLFYRFFSKNDKANISLIFSKEWLPYSAQKLNDIKKNIANKISIYFGN
ncbi:sigma factor [Mycoplasmopsis primatum]|uniref:sigma factor n=1 Tax=Mycoplasmopsis primatum TaxID=55604 RepID=UPI000497AD19|nr:sigma factor [Mycoplasmopsis primatum]